MKLILIINRSWNFDNENNVINNYDNGGCARNSENIFHVFE